MQMRFFIFRLVVLTVTTLAVPLTSWSYSDRVVYGEDNRVEFKDAPEIYQSWARSVAVLIRTNDLKATELGLDMEVNRERSWEIASLCSDERFTNEFNPGKCTGFLIAPDLLMTAGHCATNAAYCSHYAWVFDFTEDGNESSRFVKTSNVYRCKEVVNYALITLEDPEKIDQRGLDFGIIRLDRPVLDRQPLPLRREGSVKVGDELILAGYPNGLPLKIALGATVRADNSPIFFSANTDSFRGNSGSPVFNTEGVVEGILVRGERDFEYSLEKGCYQVKVCKHDECRGEDVTKISAIPGLEAYLPSLSK